MKVREVGGGGGGVIFPCSIDIDECEDSPGPCDSETEVCSNLPGTYTCKCRAGHVKGEEGRCVTQDQRDQQRDQQREAKKTKKKRRKKKQGNHEEVEEEEERRVYAWYYGVVPLTLAYLACKYWRPNAITSALIILFVAMSATLGYANI